MPELRIETNSEKVVDNYKLVENSQKIITIIIGNIALHQSGCIRVFHKSIFKKYFASNICKNILHNTFRITQLHN